MYYIFIFLICIIYLKIETLRGTWLASLGFSLGHDLTVREFEPCIRLRAGNAEPAWDSLSAPSLLTLSVSQNKYT